MRSVRILLPLGLLVAVAFPVHAGWEEGVAAFKAGSYEQAAVEFRAVIEAKPDWAGGHLMLGQTLLKLERPDEAITALRRALELEPGAVPTQIVLAKAYLDSKRYQEAGELLAKIDAAGLTKEQQVAVAQMKEALAKATPAS